MNETDIVIPLSRYEELVKNEARVDVLIDVLNHDKAIGTDDIYRILGKPIPTSGKAASDFDTLITEL